MGRRVDGVLLLIAVVVGLLLIARIDGVRVAGKAVAVPGAGVPQVGDCLREVTGSLADSLRGSLPSSSVTSVGETSVRFSDCGEQHVGEVVAFRLTPPRSGGPGTPESDSLWCRKVAQGYRSPAKGLPVASGDLWNQATNFRFVAILSAPAEYSWAACALLAPGLELYSGSYVESMAGHPAPAPFGRCRSGDDNDRWVSCDASHRVQEFGVAVQAGMSPPGAVAECKELVQAITGMPDVNAGGVLKIQVVGGHSADGDVGDPDADAVPAHGRCRLIAVGAHQLFGTLIGIGTGPLPLG